MAPKSPPGRAATHLVFPLLSFPFLTHFFWAQKFSKAHGCRSVCALRISTGLHCEFDKQRQCSNSSCNELGAFISFLLCFFLLAHPSFCYWLFYTTGIMDAIVSLPLCSQFIWFCLFSLLTNYCLRGKKCFEPLIQSDLFWCSGCSFIKSSSLLAVTAPSKFLIATKPLFTTVSNQKVNTVGGRTGSNSSQPLLSSAGELEAQFRNTVEGTE